MATYEDHISVLEEASGSLPSATTEAACDALSFVVALHNLYVDSGVLNDEAEVDVGVLENLVDAYHGELAAAAIFLSEDAFKSVPDILRATSAGMVDSEGVVPLTVRRGFDRLASRIEQARKQKLRAMQAITETSVSTEPA